MQHRKLEILKQALGACQKSGNEYLFSCPKCDHHKKKLSVNIEKDVFKCWICDYRGSKIHRLVRKYGSFSQRKEWESFSPIEIPSDLKAYFEDYYDPSVTKERVNLPEEFVTLTKPNKSKNYRLAMSYLQSRGLSVRDIVYWKMGYCSEGDYGGRIVVPSFDNSGNVNYFVGRSFVDLFYKYKNPKVDKRDMVFNELFIDWTRDLTLVEGVFDAIKAVNAVPILGSTLTVKYRLFQEIVRHDTPVYIALDKDALKKAYNLIEDLIKYEVEVYRIDTSLLETDIGDLTREQFINLKDSAYPMSSTALLREKMRMAM